MEVIFVCAVNKNLYKFYKNSNSKIEIGNYLLCNNGSVNRFVNDDSYQRRNMVLSRYRLSFRNRIKNSTAVVLTEQQYKILILTQRLTGKKEDVLEIDREYKPINCRCIV